MFHRTQQRECIVVELSRSFHVQNVSHHRERGARQGDRNSAIHLPHTETWPLDKADSKKNTHTLWNEKNKNESKKMLREVSLLSPTLSGVCVSGWLSLARSLNEQLIIHFIVYFSFHCVPATVERRAFERDGERVVSRCVRNCRLLKFERAKRRQRSSAHLKTT